MVGMCLRGLRFIETGKSCEFFFLSGESGVDGCSGYSEWGMELVMIVSFS